MDDWEKLLFNVKNFNKRTIKLNQKRPNIKKSVKKEKSSHETAAEKIKKDKAEKAAAKKAAAEKAAAEKAAAKKAAAEKAAAEKAAAEKAAAEKAAAKKAAAEKAAAEKAAAEKAAAEKAAAKKAAAEKEAAEKAAAEKAAAEKAAAEKIKQAKAKRSAQDDTSRQHKADVDRITKLVKGMVEQVPTATRSKKKYTWGNGGGSYQKFGELGPFFMQRLKKEFDDNYYEKKNCAAAAKRIVQTYNYKAFSDADIKTFEKALLLMQGYVEECLKNRAKEELLNKIEYYFQQLVEDQNKFIGLKDAVRQTKNQFKNESKEILDRFVEYAKDEKFSDEKRKKQMEQNRRGDINKRRKYDIHQTMKEIEKIESKKGDLAVLLKKAINEYADEINRGKPYDGMTRDDIKKAIIEEVKTELKKPDSERRSRPELSRYFEKKYAKAMLLLGATDSITLSAISKWIREQLPIELEGIKYFDVPDKKLSRHLESALYAYPSKFMSSDKEYLDLYLKVRGLVKAAIEKDGRKLTNEHFNNILNRIADKFYYDHHEKIIEKIKMNPVTGLIYTL